MPLLSIHLFCFDEQIPRNRLDSAYLVLSLSFSCFLSNLFPAHQDHGDAIPPLGVSLARNDSQHRELKSVGVMVGAIHNIIFEPI